MLVGPHVRNGRQITRLLAGPDDELAGHLRP
jgi:hypothetical protein